VQGRHLEKGEFVAINLSLFVEFTVAQGTARVACVADSKSEYDPRIDFYKGFRERAIKQLVKGWNAAEFRQLIKEVKSPGKQGNYEACRSGITQWARGKAITATRAPNQIWSAAGLDVSVNPELKLVVDDKRYVVKLYFKGPELTSSREEHLLFLLNETAPKGWDAGVLDVRRSRLLTAGEQDPDLEALMISDAAAFAALL
jgi:hypothetical protein